MVRKAQLLLLSGLEEADQIAAVQFVTHSALVGRRKRKRAREQIIDRQLDVSNNNCFVPLTSSKAIQMCV